MSDPLQSPRKRFPEEVRCGKRGSCWPGEKNSDEVWFGLGMFGVVGWAVAIPTVLGIFLGVWIDLKWPGPYSWTLMLLLIGLILGCLNAWFWVEPPAHMINRERDPNGD